MSRNPRTDFPPKTKGWRSGFCPVNEEPWQHERCAGVNPNGVPCVCPAHDEPEPILTPSSPGSITAPQLKKLHVCLNERGIRDRDAQLRYYAQVVGRPVDSSKELSQNEAGQVIDALERGDVPLCTPTGVLVHDGEPVTPEWFAARRDGITGTDLPKILGLTKYGNALSVWMDKRGELEDEAGEAAHWGNLLEDIVAQEWARRNGTAVQAVGVIAKVDERWKRASLDRLIVHGGCPDGGFDCGLEVKTRSAFKAGSFRDDVPDDVLAQTTWGLHVTGLDHMHVAVLIGGQKLLQFRVDRDAQLEAYLADAAAPVWHAVQNGFPPEVHPDSEGVLLELLNRIYEKRAGERDLDAAEARKWLDQYVEGNALERQAKALKTEAKTGLVQLLDDGDTGLVDGAPAFTYKAPAPADALPAKELKRLAEESPEIYEALRSDGYIQPTKPTPRFNLTGAWKDSK